MSFLIRNGKIVNADKAFYADLLVEGETIRKIGPKLKMKADEVIDATGRLVIPGGIDPHTHMEMPYGATVSSDDFETGTIAAACGGTTTILDFAAQEMEGSMMDGLEAWHRKAEGKAVIDYGFHMMVTDLNPDRLREMTELANLGVTSFKFFTAYPGRLMLDDRSIFRGMRQAKEDGTLVLMHAENGPVIDELVAQALAEGKKHPKFHALTRPARLEAEAIYRTATLAGLAGASLYVVHLSSKEGLEEIRSARKRGVKVLAETCPQYLFLDPSRYGQEPPEAAKYVMSPPIRQKADRRALMGALKSGDVQTVGTDHCPFRLKEKVDGALKDFTRIPGGVPGVENRLSLLYDGAVVKGGMKTTRFVEITSTAAAKIFGLYPKKGTIAVGSDADIVVFDPKRRETIGVANPRTHHMRVDYNVYEGTKVQGCPEIVLSRGRIVAREGQFLGQIGAGRYLKRVPGRKN